MATLRYKNPTTKKWELVGVSGSGGGSSSANSNVIFRNKANFPAVGETSILYIATDENEETISVELAYFDKGE